MDALVEPIRGDDLSVCHGEPRLAGGSIPDVGPSDDRGCKLKQIFGPVMVLKVLRQPFEEGIVIITRASMVMIFKNRGSENVSQPVTPLHGQSDSIDADMEPNQVTIRLSPKISSTFDTEYCTVTPENLQGSVVKIAGTLLGKPGEVGRLEGSRRLGVSLIKKRN